MNLPHCSKAFLSASPISKGQLAPAAIKMAVRKHANLSDRDSVGVQTLEVDKRWPKNPSSANFLSINQHACVSDQGLVML